MAQATVTGGYDASRFGALHDAQYDHLGRRLATASADKVVRIWNTEKQEMLQELRGHKAAVMTVAWAHGRFATTLASAAADGHVIIWRESKPGEWQVVHQVNVTGCVSEIAFCPPEYGLALAVGSLDELGVLTILSRKEILASPVQPAGEQWLVKAFPAHDGGVIGVSWAPSTSSATLATGPAVNRAAVHATRRLVTCGADGVMCVWHGDAKTDTWKRQHDLSAEQHRGGLRAVAWRPNMGIPTSIIASCTQEGTVALWAQDVEGKPWELRSSWKVDGDARRLAWSRAGAFLCVSIGEASTALFKEGSGGKWDPVFTSED